MQTTHTMPVVPPEGERLARIERARQDILSDGAVAPTDWVEPWIDRSWRRCLARGFQPSQRLSFDAVSSAEARRALEASQPLLQAAAPVIRSLARAMADTRYFAVLTDAQGIVINVNGPIDHQNPQASAIARIGVNLSEAAVGTTAIGATLTELQPVWLHRGEHFFNDTTIYSCAGAPLFGPNGRCVGMLDLTGIDVPERPALKHLVTQSARNIENALTLAQPHRLLLRISWPGAGLGEESDGLLGVDGEGNITAVNRAAANMLALHPGSRWPHASDVFAVPVESLFDLARIHRPTELPLWSGLRLQVLASSNQKGVEGSRSHAMPGLPLKDVETALIRKAVDDARGNVMEAARTLGISRATVYRKLMRKKKGG